MDDDAPLQIAPPLILAVADTACWKCNGKMKAAALIAPNILAAPGDVLILQHMAALPAELLEFVQSRVPDFRRGQSMAGEYMASHCPACGAITGDFYLFSEPGGAFWPETDEDAAAIRLEDCPISDAISIDAGYGVGLGEYILEAATRVD